MLDRYKFSNKAKYLTIFVGCHCIFSLETLCFGAFRSYKRFWVNLVKNHFRTNIGNAAVNARAIWHSFIIHFAGFFSIFHWTINRLLSLMTFQFNLLLYDEINHLEMKTVQRKMDKMGLLWCYWVFQVLQPLIRELLNFAGYISPLPLAFIFRRNDQNSLMG